ncbi:MAG: proteasome-activating nucleotidase, partial [Candidatus Methanomethylophilaceae archaeon]|nr:proteasome-activating nucleotidase [Candidatus Methanomethylophilaceae archaeon]
MEDLQAAENDKRHCEGELYRVQKDLARLRSELERIKAPPLIVATLRDLLPDNRVLVKSTTGPDFVVAVSEYCPPEDLVVGARVALNKQTLALMNVLPSPFDPVVSGAEIMEKPKV